MQLPHNLWSRVALAALAAGATSCAPSEPPAQTANRDAQPLPTESCEATEGGQGQDRVDLFIDSCPCCGMG